MKQIITLLVLLFTISTSSYAVTTVAENNATTNLKIDSQQDSFFGKAKVFVSKTVNKITNAVKSMDDDKQLILILLALIISPVAVWMYEGKTWTNRVTLNLILWLLGFGVLGMIHALYLILGKK